MDLISMIEEAWSAFRLWRLRRQGLTMPADCRLAGMPFFGSEPYLITIGHHVSMADKVAFITHDGGTRVIRDREPYRKVLKYGRITILDNCVIGYRATILPGVVIGPNSIVSAGSVVTRSVPPNVVVAGNPAKPVMGIEQYAQWALAGTPDYDEAEYRRDKRAALLKMALKGGPPVHSSAPLRARPTPAAEADSGVSPGPPTASTEDVP